MGRQTRNLAITLERSEYGFLPQSQSPLCILDGVKPNRVVRDAFSPTVVARLYHIFFICVIFFISHERTGTAPNLSIQLSVGEVGNLASEARCLDPEVAPTAKKSCAKTETIGELNNSGLKFSFS